MTSGKSSCAKRTSGESEVFDPRADSNRICFKTIRLSLGVLDMSTLTTRPRCLPVSSVRRSQAHWLWDREQGVGREALSLRPDRERLHLYCSLISSR